MAAPVPSWLDRCLDIRDRMVASATFRRLATEFPLTRPIARRRARALFDVCAGFVYSQVLAAGVRLRLFDILAEGPQTASALAERMQLSREAVGRLLAASASLQLVVRRGDAYALGPLGAPLAGNEALVALIEHHALLYEDLRDPVGLLRGKRNGTALSAYWRYADGAQPATARPDEVAEYTTLMSASQPLVAAEILDAFGMGAHRCLLDVGGGEGAFLAAAAARAPHLKLLLFDLPAVAARARVRLAAAGLGERAAVTGGDFRMDELPRGADVISLVRVVHDHDDATVRDLLRSTRRALPSEGVLLLAEPMAGTPGAEPMGDAYFGFYLLAMGRGRPRTRDELRALLRESGFRRVEWVPTRMPLQCGLIVARP
jgi:demethylspheroidene O-methyltransferase